MIRPIDIHDHLTRVPLLERIQQTEKAAEQGQQKYAPLVNEQMTRQQLEIAPSVHQDERVKDSYERGRQQSRQSREQSSKKRPAKETPADEGATTLLGLEIDLLA